MVVAGVAQRVCLVSQRRVDHMLRNCCSTIVALDLPTAVLRLLSRVA
jgi:hypothetical protein